MKKKYLGLYFLPPPPPPPDCTQFDMIRPAVPTLDIERSFNSLIYIQKQYLPSLCVIEGIN